MELFTVTWLLQPEGGLRPEYRSFRQLFRLRGRRVRGRAAVMLRRGIPPISERRGTTVRRSIALAPRRLIRASTRKSTVSGKRWLWSLRIVFIHVRLGKVTDTVYRRGHNRIYFTCIATVPLRWRGQIATIAREGRNGIGQGRPRIGKRAFSSFRGCWARTRSGRAGQWNRRITLRQV